MACILWFFRFFSSKKSGLVNRTIGKQNQHIDQPKNQHQSLGKYGWLVVAEVVNRKPSFEPRTKAGKSEQKTGCIAYYYLLIPLHPQDKTSPTLQWLLIYCQSVLSLSLNRFESFRCLPGTSFACCCITHRSPRSRDCEKKPNTTSRLNAENGVVKRLVTLRAFPWTSQKQVEQTINLSPT